MKTHGQAISLFSGAGGIDYGLEAAGFKTAVTLEIDADCCSTMRASRPNTPVIDRDIFDVKTEEILEVGGLKAKQVELLVGGPPCQPFSKAGYWSRGDALRLEDPRADTLSAYLRVVEEALPHVFLLENVEGLAYEGKDEGIRLLEDHIRRINRRTRSNYVPRWEVLNAATYGVPQLRERVILVACRDGIPFSFPTTTHYDPNVHQLALPVAGLQPFRTAWDAIGGMEPEAGEDVGAKGKWAELLPTIPEGKNYLHHTDRGEGEELFGWRRRYWTFLLKLAKALPSWTIQAQPGPAVGPFHWNNRRLSVRELARIQTFPENVTFVGGRTSVQKQLGNAVPSLLAEVLGRQIARVYFDKSPRGPLKLLPPDRSADRPAPEPWERKIPKQYRPLIGKHSAHPGTGKGNAARLREAAV
jgi:DNA (cytosine-5)-methyltransferase 1